MAVYNIMLTKERVQLTEYVQSLNITAYNRGDKFTPFRKRKSNSTSIHNHHSLKMRLSTAMSDTQPPAEDRCRSVGKQTTDVQTTIKGKTNQDINHKKRRHITDCSINEVGVNLNTRNAENQTYKEEGVTTRRKSEIVTILQSKRSTVGPMSITSKINYAKKSKTGKELVLNDTHFQSWINEVLLQSCDQKFDRTVNLSAVKKYMVDSASLTALGIKQSEISRIYRSLHVYSVGFSKLIKEIRGISTKAYRNIWKVYSILLQYCSSGDFQTMISEIESQNIRKFQKLEDELQQKQDIIEQNDELNRQKNSKVFKEIKALKQENFQLVLQKDVISNDCKEFQKAFNEQVSLRMLFQEKINSIHCVYRELSDKHAALYKEYHQKSSEIGYLQEQNKRITEENTKIKKEKYGIESHNKILVHELAQLKEQLAKLEQQYMKRSIQQNQLKLQRVSLSKELLQAQQECKKMSKELQIVSENNKLLRETYHILQLEYEQCLGQNRKLLSTVQEQFGINKRYFEERQKLDRGLVDYQNEKALYQKKIEEREKLIQELKQKIVALQEKVNNMQEESQLTGENITKLMQDVSLAQQTISKLKIINDNNERLIEQQEIRIRTLEKELQQSIKHKQHMEDKTKQQELKLNDLGCKNKTLESQLHILQQKLSTELKSRQKSKEKELAEKKKEERQSSIVRKECLEKQTQVDKLKQVTENTMLELKNQRFEKKNLELSYKQCLTVIENYNNVINDINARHSDLENKLEQERKMKKISQIKYENEIKKLRESHKLLDEKNKELTGFTLKHRGCIHPMIFQDYISKLERLKQKSIQREEELKITRKGTKQAAQMYELTLNQKENQIVELSKKLKQTEHKLTLQVQYQKKKNLELSKELQDVEMQLVVLKHNYKSPVEEFKEKELRYLEIIREKKEKVESLIDEIEIMHDENHRLMEKITHSEKQLSTYRQKIEGIQEDIFQLQNQKRKIQSQRDQAVHQLNEVKNQFKLELSESSLKISQSKECADLVRKSSGGKSQDIYLRERTKSIEMHGTQAYREITVVEKQLNAQKAEKQSRARVIRGERQKRQDFAHKFKNASQYYLK